MSIMDRVLLALLVVSYLPVAGGSFLLGWHLCHRKLRQQSIANKAVCYLDRRGNPPPLPWGDQDG